MKQLILAKRFFPMKFKKLRNDSVFWEYNFSRTYSLGHRDILFLKYDASGDRNFNHFVYLSNSLESLKWDPLKIWCCDDTIIGTLSCNCSSCERDINLQLLIYLSTCAPQTTVVMIQQYRQTGENDFFTF
jgi:hypothetical protein